MPFFQIPMHSLIFICGGIGLPAVYGRALVPTAGGRTPVAAAPRQQIANLLKHRTDYNIKPVETQNPPLGKTGCNVIPVTRYNLSKRKI